MRKAAINVRVIRKISDFCLPLLCAAAFALVTVSSSSQEQGKPALMVLGSAHFANPGRDNVNPEVADVLTERRQQEMEAVVRRLAEFRPTRIAVEIGEKNQAALDKRYQDYREGRYELGRGEDDQLGLRLAALLGHERVYAVDWNGIPPGGADLDWFAYGQTHGHQAELDAITDPENARRFYVELKDQTISQWLKQLNAPDALLASHNMYFDISRVGDGEDLIGADWVGTWYARNLKIYSRLVNLATEPDDRVLVIYGQGHAYLLQQFAREDGIFNVVGVDEILKE